jgi:8-oxo-dGTP diphosphatase
MDEKIQYHATVVFLRRGNKILLGKKTRGIGEGRFNGPGGSIEKGESPRDSAAREVFEETGIRILPESLERIAVVYFHNYDENDLEKFVCECHMFSADEFQGEPHNTDELAEQEWFGILPLSEMMAADRDWLPIALNKKIIAHAHIKKRQSVLFRPTEIIEVGYFPEE